jgi:hypothetical protein
MGHSAGSARCVFCGSVIGPDEPSSGRPPMAAHAACADAALADDRHWDAVAGAEPGSDLPDAPVGGDRPEVEARRAGCLAIAAVVLLVLAVLLG